LTNIYFPWYNKSINKTNYNNKEENQMAKLIDLLNELAVAEAETEAIEEAIEAGAEDNGTWVKFYNIEFNKFNEVVELLQKMIGIDSKTAKAMIINHRTELVKIAAREM
jgi:hypothetical protein